MCIFFFRAKCVSIFYCNFVIVIDVFGEVEKFLKKSCVLPLFFPDFGV